MRMPNSPAIAPAPASPPRPSCAKYALHETIVPAPSRPGRALDRRVVAHRPAVDDRADASVRERAAAEGRALERAVLRQRRRGGHDLERGAGRVEAEARAIEQSGACSEPAGARAASGAALREETLGPRMARRDASRSPVAGSSTTTAPRSRPAAQQTLAQRARARTWSRTSIVSLRSRGGRAPRAPRDAWARGGGARAEPARVRSRRTTRWLAAARVAHRDDVRVVVVAAQARRRSRARRTRCCGAPSCARLSTSPSR